MHESTLYKGRDFENPDWDAAGRVHDWRNYISDDVRAIWHTFTLEQRRLLAEQADAFADREEWE